MKKKIVKLIQKFFPDADAQEIIEKSAWSFGFKFYSLVIGYIFTIFVTRLLGPTPLGLFNIAMSIISFLNLLTYLGFPTAIIRFTGEFTNDRALIDILKKMVSISIPIFCVVIAGITLYAGPISTNLLHDPRLQPYLILVALASPFTFLFTLSVEFIRGLRIIKVSETLRNLTSTFNLIFILILFYIFTLKGLSLPLANLFSSITISVISIFYLFKIIKRLSFTKHTRISYSYIFSVSLPLLVTTLMGTLLNVTDKLMLGIFSSAEEVGIYSVALKLATLTGIVGVSINMIVAPKISQHFWQGEKESLIRTVRIASKLFFYSSAPILLIYFLIPQPILSIFGKEFVVGVAPLIFLSIGHFISALTGPVGYFLMMTGEEKIFRNIVTISAVINVFLNYLLIPRYGASGAAIATGFALVVWNISSLIYIKVKHGIYVGYYPNFLRNRKSIHT